MDLRTICTIGKVGLGIVTAIGAEIITDRLVGKKLDDEGASRFKKICFGVTKAGLTAAISGVAYNTIIDDIFSFQLVPGKDGEIELIAGKSEKDAYSGYHGYESGQDSEGEE